MGTRSIIAKVDGDGFIGRYCHWDGYPSHMLPELVHVLTGHHDGGAVAALEVLLAHDWSSIGHGKMEVTDDPARGFAAIPSFGIAHDEGEPMWFEYHGESEFDTDCEYAYAIDAVRGRISVFDLPWKGTPLYLGAWDLANGIPSDEDIALYEPTVEVE